MLVPTRNYSNPVYRYGFQGQEKDNEIKDIGTKQKIFLIFVKTITHKLWIYKQT